MFLSKQYKIIKIKSNLSHHNHNHNHNNKTSKAIKKKNKAILINKVLLINKKMIKAIKIYLFKN